MKTLYLYRHAKSSWIDPELNDLDRPLNPRGERDALSMAKRMKERGVVIDEMVCSPAKRCRSTLAPVLKSIKYPLDLVDFYSDIYQASHAQLLLCLHRRLAQSQSVMLIGHNPGLTGFANFLAGPRIDNLPTAGLVRLDIAVSAWTDLSEGQAEWIYVESPKRLMS